MLSSSAGRLFFVLTLILLLPILPSYGQDGKQISRLGPTDYQSYQADLLIVRARLNACEQALQQALGEKQNIERSLAAAQMKYNELLASVMQHSEG